MDIRLAVPNDIRHITRYDSHIPTDRVAESVDRGFVYVLCSGETVVGILRYSLFWQTIPFLDLILIDDAFRNQGWGSKMMACWETAMKALGYDHVMLSTQADEHAFLFYEKLGYRRIGSFLPPEQEAEELMYLKKLGE